MSDDASRIPEAKVVRRRRSFAWLAPAVVAVIVAALLVAQTLRERGPTIVISFDDAQGLEPGHEIVHRGMRAGVVRDVRLTPDLSGVEVIAQLEPHAAALAVEGSAFWIVRPELSLQRVRGLETLLGPRYISVRPGEAGGVRARRFDGLAEPPTVGPAQRDGLRLQLLASRAGSLAVGSAVTYRDLPVGVVRGYELAADATGVVVEIEVQAQYAALVRTNTRFWRAAGVGVDFGLFRGLSVEAESLGSLLEGSIAMATPNRPGDRVANGAVFELAERGDEDWLEWAPEIPIRAPVLVDEDE